MANKKRGVNDQARVYLVVVLIIVLSIALALVKKVTDISPSANLSEYRISESERVNGYVLQHIKLNKGWNLVSLNVVPDSYETARIFYMLVRKGDLLLVKNGAGQVYWPSMNVNQMPNMNANEGYWVYVNNDSVLSVKGMPIKLPFTLTFKQGWNIMSYPLRVTRDGLKVVQPLINNESLGVVVDDKENKIEKVGTAWVNGIGQFKPGFGYRVYVNKDTSLVIN